MTKYKDLLKRFQGSGLTQREFAKREGISASTLSYHLNKDFKGKQKKRAPGFSSLQITPVMSDEKQIKIITSSGTEIHIPL